MVSVNLNLVTSQQWSTTLTWTTTANWTIMTFCRCYLVVMMGSWGRQRLSDRTTMWLGVNSCLRLLRNSWHSCCTRRCVITSNWSRWREPWSLSMTIRARRLFRRLMTGIMAMSTTVTWRSFWEVLALFALRARLCLFYADLTWMAMAK